MMIKGKMIILDPGLILSKIKLMLARSPKRKTQLTSNRQGFPQRACRQFLISKETPVMVSLLGMEHLVILFAYQYISRLSQNFPRSNLSLNTNDASVTAPLCDAPLVGVSYQPTPTSPEAGFPPSSG